MTHLLSRTAWQEGDPQLTNWTLVLLGLASVALAHQFTVEIDHFVIGFDKTSLASVLVYLLAVLVVRTQPVDRITLRIVVGFAVPMFAMTYLASPDRMSSDIYRYVWDGIVQHAHVNPYRYVPGNAALTFLREPNQDVYGSINRRDYAPTIYPPVAQMFYWLATYLAPSVEAMKLMMLAFVGLTAYVLVLILRALGRSASEVLIWLWCPLIVWEVGNAGHVDAIICGLVSLALLFRLRRRPALCGLFLGMAVMTKFYPLLLLPALYQRRDWKMPATVAGVCVGGYALYSSVGWRVLGFMSGYSKEEGIDSGSRFFLLDYMRRLPGLTKLPTGAFLAFSAVVLGLLVLWAWQYATHEEGEGLSVGVSEDPSRDLRLCDAEKGDRYGAFNLWASDAERVPAFLQAAAMLAFALMLLFSPHYAWYNVWLVPFMALVPSLPLFVYVLVFFYGYTTGLSAPGPTMFLLNERIYLVMAVAFVLHVAMKRWPLWPWLMSVRRRQADRALRQMRDQRRIGAHGGLRSRVEPENFAEREAIVATR